MSIATQNNNCRAADSSLPRITGGGWLWLIAEYQFSRDLYIEERNLPLESRFYTDEQMDYAKENLKHTQRLLLGLPKQLIKKFGIDVSWE